MHGYGEIKKVYDSALPEKAMCSGCRDDFYNGNNGLGVSECWSFKDAKVCDKVGYRSIHSVTQDESKKRTLSCWHGVCK